MAKIKSWEVSDALWGRVEPLIPERKRDKSVNYIRRKGGGRKPMASRKILAGIVYVLRTGIQWKALPISVGSSSSIHAYFQEWERAGFFKKIWINARAVQSERFAGLGFYCNAHMTSKDLPHYCRIGAGEQMMLRHAINNFHRSPRAYDRILKVARTIADLAQSPDIDETHLFEAINYRNFDRGEEW